MTAPDTDVTDAPMAASPRRPRAVIALAALIVLLIGVLLGTAIERVVTGETTPSDSPGAVDVGFAQDMSVHHGQAVEMSALALTNSTDPEIRSLAYDVVATQQSQIGTMTGWLTMWDRPTVSSGPVMSWMPHESMGPMEHAATMTDMPTPDRQAMPGMATTAELADLRALTGTAFDTRYLQLLLRHHRGGVPMAQFAAERAVTPEVRVLAGQIAAAQQAESAALEQMLAGRGAAPLPAS